MFCFGDTPRVLVEKSLSFFFTHNTHQNQLDSHRAASVPIHESDFFFFFFLNVLPNAGDTFQLLLNLLAPIK